VLLRDLRLLCMLFGARVKGWWEPYRDVLGGKTSRSRPGGYSIRSLLEPEG